VLNVLSCLMADVCADFLAAYQRGDVFFSQGPQVLADLIVNPLTLGRMIVPVPK